MFIVRKGIFLFRKNWQISYHVIVISKERGKQWGPMAGSSGGGATLVLDSIKMEKGSQEFGLCLGSLHTSGRFIICPRHLFTIIKCIQPPAFPRSLSHTSVTHILGTCKYGGAIEHVAKDGMQKMKLGHSSFYVNKCRVKQKHRIENWNGIENLTVLNSTVTPTN